MLYYFKQWQDGDVNVQKTLMLSSDTTLTAYYVRGVNLSIVAVQNGITDPPAGNYMATEGSQVMVTAIPNASYKFASWLLDGTVKTENPISVLMDAEHTLQPNFEYVPPPPETGVVTGIIKDKQTGQPVPGASVTCDGYVDISEADGKYSLTLPPQGYTLRVNKAGYAETSAAVDVVAGMTVTLDVLISVTPSSPILEWWNRRSIQEKTIIISSIPLTIIGLLKFRRG